MARALSARGLPPRLILTGQHDLDPAEFGLASYPSTRLSCRGTRDPHAHVRRVTAAVGAQLRNRPDLLIVQGDTSSALGGALAALSANVPVAHVEAGLRSHDPRVRWPEEEYRTAIDAKAELLFAPTPLAAANLRREGVGGAVFVTGNTGIDAVMAIAAALPPPVLRERGVPQLLVTCHRRENWGEGLCAVASALCQLAASGTARIDVMLHPNPHVSARMQELLGPCPGITLVPPCTQAELAARMRNCDLMLSDSGGVQEEAPVLGVPLLVLRDKTERPEGLWTGNLLLVGTETERIAATVTNLLRDPVALSAMAKPCLPYGDGRAGHRIASLIEQWLLDQPAAKPRIRVSLSTG